MMPPMPGQLELPFSDSDCHGFGPTKIEKLPDPEPESVSKVD
jgi:hypothetical protein